MTAQELFNLTVGVMGQSISNSQTYADIYLPNLNTILADTFKLENNNRAYNDVKIPNTTPTLLTTIPTITSLSDVLNYQESVIRNVLVWGLARQFALSDDDTMKTSFYAQQYADGYNNENKAIPKPIIDYLDESVL